MFDPYYSTDYEVLNCVCSLEGSLIVFFLKLFRQSNFQYGLEWHV